MSVLPSAVARRLIRSACAWASWRSASSACSITSGLDSSINTVPGSTCAPGRRGIRSTRPAVSAVIRRICSGTRVPGPLTSRSIGPRFTVSVHRPERSTTGAAARSLERPNVIAASAAATLTPMIRLRFRVFRGLRGMSTTLVRGSILEISGCIG